MTQVTNAMLHAAACSLVKDKILPKVAPMEAYEHHYESVERAIKAALEKQGQEL